MYNIYSRSKRRVGVDRKYTVYIHVHLQIICVCHVKIGVYHRFPQIGYAPEELLGIPKPGVSPLDETASEPANFITTLSENCVFRLWYLNLTAENPHFKRQIIYKWQFFDSYVSLLEGTPN